MRPNWGCQLQDCDLVEIFVDVVELIPKVVEIFVDVVDIIQNVVEKIENSPIYCLGKGTLTIYMAINEATEGELT
ncbi:hypothetical protein DYI25_16770 [Mesobacillus boroniphilus]|uniref:Uncharacterized protein n=1 Tax=Mesobacillus boroniphilus TaxID=308892 RepID=A0A944CNM8_9BACI|nr:hypothetical protein [Mesobacillus boroniphilus]